MTLLPLVCSALLMASVTTFVFVMLSQPLLPPPLHGLRGLKRMRARASVDLFRDAELPLRWLGARVAPAMSPKRHAALARRITLAGEVWGLWPAEMQALGLLGMLAGVSLGSACTLYSGNLLWTLAGAAFGALAPGMQLSSTGRARLRDIQRRIPHVVDLLVLSLGAGLDFPAALRQVVERSPDTQSALLEELGLILEELKLGRTRRQAFECFAERAPCDEVRDLVSATIQAEEQGTALGCVLESQASSSRQRRSTRAEEAASKASTAMVLPTTLLFVALMILLIGPMLLETSRKSAGMMG